MRSSRLLGSQAPALTTIFLCLGLSPHPTLGAKGATVRLPDELAAASTSIKFEGFGGYNRGNYRGDEFRGEFTRIESRLGVFDPLYVANRGKSSFTLEDSAGSAWLSANCRAMEKTATARIVTLDLRKLTYTCAFSGSVELVDSRFVLGEPKRDGFKEKLLARDRRRGEAFLLGQEILIESVHEYEGSRLDSQAPLGYLLESGGRIVGAVDLLDWNPVLHLRKDLTDSARQSAVIVAVALAVLRDPANSMLED